MTQRDIDEAASQRRRILLTVGASLAVLIVAAGLAVVYDVGGLRSSAVTNVSEAYGDVVFRNMRANCIQSANDTVRNSGGNPSAPDVERKLTAYCDCFVADARAQFTIAEIAEIEKVPDGIASNSKVKAIIDHCVAEHVGP